MKCFIYKLLILFIWFNISISFCFADLNISISPYRNEIILEPGSSATWEIVLYNQWDEDEDFQIHFEECINQYCSKNLSGWVTDNNFSAWIHIPELEKTFTVISKNSKKIQYNIAIPKSAKWGTYLGAIKTSRITWNVVKNGVWSMLILTVNADLQTKLDIWKATIFSLSKRDRILDEILNYFNPFSYRGILREEGFNVRFDVPIKNSWNTRIKPTWKIEILDKNSILENIGSQIISNNEGYVLGEEITNYLPINPNWRILLPSNDMILNSDWHWFAYNLIDQNWNKLIQYFSPWEYYSDLNVRTKKISLFNKIVLRETFKDLRARIYVDYNNSAGWENNSQEIPFTIKYNEIKIIPNEALFFWFNFIVHMY